MKKQAAPAQSGPDAGPWINLGNGRSRSASTGRMRYDPSADPEYQQAIKRIQGQEQAAAAKRALDALGAVPDPGYFAEGVQIQLTPKAAAYELASQVTCGPLEHVWPSNRRVLDIVGSVVKGCFGREIGGSIGNYVGASLDAEQPHKDATVMKNAQPFKPEQADGTWSPPRAVYQVINVRPPSPDDVKHIKQFFANVSRASGRST